MCEHSSQVKGRVLLHTILVPPVVFLDSRYCAAYLQGVYFDSSFSPVIPQRIRIRHKIRGMEAES